MNIFQDSPKKSIISSAIRFECGHFWRSGQVVRTNKQTDKLDKTPGGRPFGATRNEKCNSARYVMWCRLCAISIRHSDHVFERVCPKRFPKKHYFLCELKLVIFVTFCFKITVWHMAVLRVYVRRGTIVWSMTSHSITHLRMDALTLIFHTSIQ